MATERFTILGRLEAGTMPAWIERHARRLGLRVDVIHSDAGALALDLEGPSELLDAMEMGCLLGPFEIWVDSVRRSPDRECG